MSYYRCPCSSDIADAARELGFVAVGAARAECVDRAAMSVLEQWIAEGNHGEMAWMERHFYLRLDPRLVLEGARTVISVAISYRQTDTFADNMPAIAAYARGDDYHEVVRSRLEALARIIENRYGGATRCCVDTAPVMERYWAVKSGIGIRGRNGMVIVPGYGSTVFLGEILTTVEFMPDKPLDADCGGCMKCVHACPGGALRSDGTLDCRKCLSYLTIEHRGEFTPGTDLHGLLYGCDICQKVCPHNDIVAADNGHTNEKMRIAEFGCREQLRGLTPQRVLELNQEQFSTIFSHSAIKRAKLAGLQRNARAILKSN